MILLGAVTGLFAAGCSTYPTSESGPAKDSFSRTLLEMENHPDAQVMTALNALFDDNLTAFRAIVIDRSEAQRRLRNGLTYLHYAVDRGQLDFIEYLVALQAPINARERAYGWTPLHIATVQEHTPVIERLLAAGANPARYDRLGWQPIHIAAAKSSTAVLDSLIQGGANPAALTRGRVPGDQPIHLAAIAGNVANVERLLQAGIHIDAVTTPNGQTSLHRAASEGLEDMVTFLIGQGAAVDARNVNERSVLHLASYDGQVAVIEQLIAAGVTIDSRDKNSVTPLQAAAAAGHPQIIRLLLEAGAVLESVNKDGLTPLSWAAWRGHVEAVELLIAQGAHIEVRDVKDRTPLYRAAQNGHASAVARLIELGADIDPSDATGRTPLMAAAEGGHVEAIQTLLDAGADILAQTSEGIMPLDVAVGFGQPDALRILLKRGAPVDGPDQRPWTALHIAIAQNCVECVRVLLDHGADVGRQDEHGFNVLGSTIDLILPEIAALLLQHGADAAHPQGPIGWTPLSSAAWHNRTDLVTLLLEHGADLEAGDSSGQRPLLIAARRQHHDMIARLLEAGAEPYGAAENGLTAWHYAQMAEMDETVALIEQYGGAPPDELELVRIYFELFRPDAEEVLVAGLFNNWGAQRLPMERREDGTWYAEADVFDVVSGYKFIVNGVWITDPENPNIWTDRGFGSDNSTLIPSERLVENYVPQDRSGEPQPQVVTIQYTNTTARRVYLVGEFNGWDVNSLPMTRGKDGVWTRQLRVMPGDYGYKFVVDNEWIIDPANDQVKTVDGIENSLLAVPAS